MASEQGLLSSAAGAAAASPSGPPLPSSLASTPSSLASTPSAVPARTPVASAAPSPTDGLARVPKDLSDLRGEGGGEPLSLQQFYQREWVGTRTGTQTAFCAKYKCHQGNFSAWLNRGRGSPASERAVRAFEAEVLAERAAAAAASSSPSSTFGAPLGAPSFETPRGPPRASPIGLSPISLSATSPVPSPEAVSLAGMADDALRDEYKQTWTGTQIAFCKQFQCNQGNFSMWLRGKRSPASAAAVRSFISGRTTAPPSPSAVAGQSRGA
eukprot:c12627_g1_i1.p2 GENE.c12627_g1_i1~~c12627_g1_i1.p2  ORF type:complete len:269 (+),score=15.64 c12627_g1_i1:277-1083(+)